MRLVVPVLLAAFVAAGQSSPSQASSQTGTSGAAASLLTPGRKPARRRSARVKPPIRFLSMTRVQQLVHKAQEVKLPSPRILQL